MVIKEVVPFKIGLISTHGTGKTTLAYEIASHLKKRGFKVKVISEVATEAFEEGIPINEGTNLQAQMHVLLRHMAEELKATARNYEIIIADRSVYDNWIYLERKCGYRQFVIDFIREYAKEFPYSALYKLPLVGELKEDGVRDAQNKDFQVDIDKRLTHFLNDSGVEHTELPVPSTEFRGEWSEIIVNDTLKRMKKWQKTLSL